VIRVTPRVYGLEIQDNSITTSKVIDANITAAKLSAQESWNAPTLLNSWVNFGAGYPAAGYMKDHLGFIRLRGLVKNGTVNGTTGVIFTLPSGYRPSGASHFAVEANSAHGCCRVDTNGDVVATAGSNVWFSLDGINFDTR
jgi:hypothetical protein